MFLATDTSYAPWYVVNADDMQRVRFNCISHLLSLIPYKELEQENIKLPDRQQSYGYEEPKNCSYNVVSEVF
jgi:polyphosphate kinase